MIIIMICPKCGHKSVTTNKDGSTFCRYCGYKGPTKEFQENIKES